MLKRVLLALLLFAVSFGFVKADEQAEKEAIDAANAWLALVDEGDYTGSFDQAASLFQGAVKKVEWQQQMNAVRKPLGKLLSRKVKSSTYATSLPVGPPMGNMSSSNFRHRFKTKRAPSKR